MSKPFCFSANKKTKDTTTISICSYVDSVGKVECSTSKWQLVQITSAQWQRAVCIENGTEKQFLFVVGIEYVLSDSRNLHIYLQLLQFAFANQIKHYFRCVFVYGINKLVIWAGACSQCLQHGCALVFFSAIYFFSFSICCLFYA